MQADTINIFDKINTKQFFIYDIIFEKFRLFDRRETISLPIAYNGIGRKLSETINASKKKTKGSYGLKMSEDRIKFLQDIYGKETTVQILDLGNPSGTKVVIRLPVQE